ncbi:MBL fold metallo-hydrolase [Pseudoflavitalea sp. G-6-1-2]|uniref:MBL fold metallo-hydrolase n=1 Tax=Pseudoflavitalea sp. G-6-1-2 TaxID=2728841 RepID=UPI00146E160A|nr:MBL fold metallo-hydrolase [Pseudoflavitalea sp. G-6-1-2]NML20554.1 MBL fold metallo-hydrolase [Pseudoflavitalea sp. G-6-1-2]
MSYPALTITFLGTGTSSGVPMIACECPVCTSSDPKDNRLRSSIMVQSATTTLVVDSGPDFRCQMLREKVKKLDAILFTHSHKDHLAGLDDIRAFNFFSHLPTQIYATEPTQEAIVREFPYAFYETRYPGLPELKLNTISSAVPFKVGDIPVTPILVWHLKMPVLGFRFGSFTYITDANRIDEEEKEKIRGSQTLVLNALRKESHISHFSLSEAIAISQELKIPQSFFTHISHQLGKHQDVSAELPENISLAYDGMRLQVPASAQ